MKFPGFTAESSLQSITTQHRSTANRVRSRRGSGVIPQQIVGGTAVSPWWWRCPPGCFPTGNPWRPCFCWITHLPGFLE
jgi:hypothetical protein